MAQIKFQRHILNAINCSSIGQTVLCCHILKFRSHQIDIDRKWDMAMTYREFPGLEYIDICMGPCSDQQCSELACSDKDEGRHYKSSKPMAYDFQMPPNPKVLLQHHSHIGFFVKDLSEVLQSQYL